MAYSDNPDTVRNRITELGPLMQGEAAEWYVDKGHEKLQAYRIRECLHIARNHPTLFPGLAEADEKFSISIEEPGLVVTTAKGARQRSEVEVRPSNVAVAPRHKGPEPVTVTGAQTVTDIASAWMNNERKLPMHFPEAVLDDEDLKNLYRFAKNRDLMLFWSSEAGLTIRTFNEDLEEHAFHPDG